MSYPAEPFLNICTEIILPEASCVFFFVWRKCNSDCGFFVLPQLSCWLSRKLSGQDTESGCPKVGKRAALAIKILYQRIWLS